MKVKAVMNLAYDVVTKVRLLRHYEKANTAGVDELSERELFACELIQGFAPLREWQLGRALKLQTTSLRDLVKNLMDKGWVEMVPANDRRQKPLALTGKGQSVFAEIKRRSARRYWYVFHNLPQLGEMDQLLKVLTLMNQNATKAIRANVFGELPDDDDDVPLTSGLWLPPNCGPMGAYNDIEALDDDLSESAGKLRQSNDRP